MTPRQKKPEVVKVKPIGAPYKCPVCNGFGTLKYGEKVCQGCDGRGYILVPVEELDG